MTFSRLLFPVTLLISALAHGAFFLNLDPAPASAAPIMEQIPQLTRVVFNQAPVFTPETAIVTPKISPKKEQKITPKKPEVKVNAVAKPMSIPKSISIPNVPKIASEPETKPAKVEQRKVIKTVEQKMLSAAEPPPVVAVATPKKIATVVPALSPEQEDEKQHYMMALLAHIESHKYYPRAARKRGIEGYVNVSFSLSPSGELSVVDVAGGPALLRRAARKAVKSSLPLPKPPAILSESLSVKYRMAFILQ